MAGCPALVSAEWLHKKMAEDGRNLVLFDATFHIPGPGIAEFQKNHIETAQFFNIMKIPNPTKYIPTNIPEKEKLQEYLRSLGVNSSSHVILYETAAAEEHPFIGPRLWWTLRAFGHKKVSVLDGGLVRWMAEGYPVTDDLNSVQYGDVTLDLDKSLMLTYDDIINNLNDKTYLGVDSRPVENFTGEEKEPSAMLQLILPPLRLTLRDVEGLQSGHIPGARNVPYPSVYREDSITMKGKLELEELFQQAGVDFTRPVFVSCYVGFTACQIMLAAAVCGHTDIPLYYGSWVEYGQICDKSLVAEGK